MVWWFLFKLSSFDDFPKGPHDELQCRSFAGFIIILLRCIPCICTTTNSDLTSIVCNKNAFHLCICSDIISLLQAFHWVCCCFVMSFGSDPHFISSHRFQLSKKQHKPSIFYYSRGQNTLYMYLNALHFQCQSTTVLKYKNNYQK